MIIKLPEEFPVILTFKNPYVESDNKEKVWNTGCCACDLPHADENPADAGKAILLVDDEARKHIASLALYHLNQFIYLNPGDAYEIQAKDAKELLYYLSIADTEILELVERSTYAVELGVTLGTKTESTESGDSIAVTATPSGASLTITLGEDTKFTVSGNEIKCAETNGEYTEDVTFVVTYAGFSQTFVKSVTLNGKSA